METVESFSKMNLSSQKKTLQLWDIYYYEKDNPLVPDEVYDQCLILYNKLSKIPYESSLGKASSKFKKYTHEYPALSLKKITNQEEYNEIVEKFGSDILIEPKIDGLTVVYYPDGSLVSRGDGSVGEVLPNAKFIPRMPKPLKHPVRMEVCIDKDVFEAHFSDSKKNPRNTAAGILRRIDYTDDVKYLTYYAYNIMGSELSEEDQIALLKENGFKVIDYVHLFKKEDYLNFYSSLYNIVQDSIAPTDGCCIKCNNPKIAKNMGSTAHHPNNAVAYKFVSEVSSSKLLDIEWSRGRTTYTPVAIFEPVILGGNKIQRASLHNLNIINKLGIKIGCGVNVTLKNEIIPQIISTFIDEDIQVSNIKIPEFCPECHSKLIINKSQELECINPKCNYRIYDDLKRLVSKQALDINGISDANITKLGDYLIKNNTELFSVFSIKLLSQDTLKVALKCTDYMANKLSGAISFSFNNIDSASFLYACNIPLLGKNTAKDIMKFYNDDINDFIKKFEYDGKHINGIGEIVYKSILDNMDIIKRNLVYISSFKKKEKKVILDKVYKIAITGKLSKPRKYYQEKIEQMGHIFSSSITKDVDYLICGENAGSKKEKSSKYGIYIVDEAWFTEMEMNNNER